MALEDVLKDILDGQTQDGVIAVESDLVKTPTPATPDIDVHGLVEKFDGFHKSRIALESFDDDSNCTKTLAMEVFTMLGSIGSSDLNDKLVGRLTQSASRHNATLIRGHRDGILSKVDEAEEAIRGELQILAHQVKTDLEELRGAVGGLERVVQLILDNKELPVVMNRKNVNLINVPVAELAYFADSEYSYAPFEGKLTDAIRAVFESDVFKERFTETSSLYDIALVFNRMINSTNDLSMQNNRFEDIERLSYATSLVKILGADSDFLSKLTRVTAVLYP